MEVIMAQGFKPGEAEAIYVGAKKLQAQRIQAEKDREKFGVYSMDHKTVDIPEDAALKQIQDFVVLAKAVDLVKIWHTIEALKDRRKQNEPGISDLLGVVEVDVEVLVKHGIQKVGIATAIEVKGSKDRVEPDQARFLERFRSKGGIAGVARSAEDVVRIVREYCPGIQLGGPK
jgi:hypothetical protein